jgi:pimeloyl-ACP methyl ester carboxylesterase
MLIARVALGLLVAYAVLVTLGWRFQDRIAFPAPRSPVPEPGRVGLAGERITATTPSGVTLAGWFLPPGHARGPSADSAAHEPRAGRAPALLWFYGNGETIGLIWPLLRDFQPPGTALLVLDYPGYGASEGRATEGGLYEAGDVAYALLQARREVDPKRIFVYGRSLGSAVASYVAARHPVAGLVLESPFTGARDMAAKHYPMIPRSLVRLGLDNVEHVARVGSPILIFHGTHDRIVPPEMGRRVAAAAGGPVELVLIEGAGHNETYDVGGEEYREKVWEFVRRR